MRNHVGTLRVNPGIEKDVKCGACGTKMKVKRNVLGPTSFAESMARGQHLHDCFRCPNQGEGWHKRIVALIEEIENTTSKKIAAIIKQEISEILKTRKGNKN